MIILLKDIDDKQIKSILNAYYDATGVSPWYIDQFAEEKRMLIRKEQPGSGIEKFIEIPKFMGDSIPLVPESLKGKMSEIIKDKIALFSERAVNLDLVDRDIVKAASNSDEDSALFINTSVNKALVNILSSRTDVVMIYSDDVIGDNSNNIKITKDMDDESIKEAIDSIFSGKELTKDDIVEIGTKTLENNVKSIHIPISLLCEGWSGDQVDPNPPQQLMAA